MESDLTAAGARAHRQLRLLWWWLVRGEMDRDGIGLLLCDCFVGQQLDFPSRCKQILVLET